ncbi:MAG TPA: hypothetical protein VGB84_02080 [Arachidicoccus sp.]
MRCSSEVKTNPYKGIIAVELSHNRAGENNSISEPDDVLWNIDPNKGFQRHQDKVICTIKIKSLAEGAAFPKTYTQTKNDKDYVGTMDLIHDPVKCMYPHSLFRVKINDELIDYNNF